MCRLVSSLVLVFACSTVCPAVAPCDTQSECDAPAACDAICSTVACDDAWIDSILKGCAEEGIVFDGDLVQYYQGIVNGGVNRTDRYGGLATYGALLDFGKLGLTQGTFLKIGAQSQFGETINGDTGSLLIAANASGVQPTPEGQDTALTDLTLMQFFSERFALIAGRLNTFDGTLNAFAHGRGKRQFMNIALATNPIAFRTVPYITYGAGLTVLGDEGTPLFTFLVLDPKDRATRSDLDELFSEGVTLSSEARLPTRWAGRPGHVLFGATWSNREVLDLSEIARLPVEQPVALPRASDSWSVYGNFDHYLCTYDKAGTKGWGVFGRWGIADDQTNPAEWFLSGGIGGNSPLCGRSNDTFGLGWYYSGTTDQIPGLVFSDDGRGVEAYYSIALTDKIFLSPDAQWMHPSRGNVDDSWALGMRLLMTL